jgi:hypothetical protein
MVRRYIQEANLFKNNALNKIKIWLLKEENLFKNNALNKLTFK